MCGWGLGIFWGAGERTIYPLQSEAFNFIRVMSWQWRHHGMVLRHLPSGWKKEEVQKYCIKARPTDDQMDNPNHYITTNCDEEEESLGIKTLDTFYSPTSEAYKATHCTSFTPEKRK